MCWSKLIKNVWARSVTVTVAYQMVSSQSPWVLLVTVWRRSGTRCLRTKYPYTCRSADCWQVSTPPQCHVENFLPSCVLRLLVPWGLLLELSFVQKSHDFAVTNHTTAFNCSCIFHQFKSVKSINLSFNPKLGSVAFRKKPFNSLFDPLQDSTFSSAGLKLPPISPNSFHWSVICLSDCLSVERWVLITGVFVHRVNSAPPYWLNSPSVVLYCVPKCMLECGGGMDSL